MHALKVFFTSILAPASVLVVACSSGKSGGSGVTGTPVALESIGAEFAKQVCPALASCCQKVGFPHDPGGCGAYGNSVQADLSKSASKAGVTFSAQAMGNCLAQWAAGLNACPANAASEALAPDCKKVIVGTVAPGGDCDLSGQVCADPAEGYATCQIPGDTSMGKCIHVVPPTEGAACNYSTTGVTLSKFTFGDCENQTDYPAFYCDRESSTCKKRLAVGESCATTTTSGGTSFDSTRCAEGAICDSKTKNCESAPGSGAACSGTCAKGFYCDTTGASTGWTCKKKLAAGEPCTTNGPSACETYCDSQGTSSGTCSAETSSASGGTIVSKKTCALDN